MSTSYVHLKVENKVGYIEFYNPPHNALPSEMLARLMELIETAGADPSVAVIVLKSGGDRTFCAGASFEELIAISNPHQGAEFFEGFANVINALRNCPKITIGRVQGKAVGGGVGLAAATDYCMATTHSEIKLSELTIGIGPFVIEPAVTRKIGLSAMSQLSLEASRFFSAQWAQEKGLFMKVCPSIGALDTEVSLLAAQLCAYNPEALQKLKKTFWEGTEHWGELLNERASVSGRLVLSDFTKTQLKKYK
ncbi:enoyl-CoA hydratase/isomerase family protein [Formosa sp. Hel1_33_131]|uniref:enoyl-CoA hydratase/isomerase family protein n=1 Tax=Formosa sp. Hel1_33_131 TaxID=1336794 RepID=UPI00084E35CB|nr:enoyl-CoA hydratase/isomerase family protein [Formosa sp. Hel1_33_131]